ncbi:restriction endonuclease [[Bacillus] enclensis]|uniref:Type I restriction enzyme, R subunit n=1 Tax=[Bacillus] enclensis TaxID=1402860 RepID=A0A0V8HPW9_9BACI|nr:DEAD/DEAH box helicase family protein [[Bacillus] enclensis]KSU64627.1 restriction endonuclease [[Bacillus] enclensis]SCB77323.1 type I restriction enzyme, R subunit [[Bacillus] enclensis]
MPVTANQLREKEDYQQLILERLKEDNGYLIRPAVKYNPRLAIDTEVLLQFLENTQPDVMERLRKFYKNKTEQTIINFINQEINKSSRSLIDVLKNGVEFDNGATLQLMFRQPATSFNQKATGLYNANILSVMEEVYHKEDERIDLVIFLNGLAIFAVELKCNTSGQNYEDAIKQFKEERDHNTRLFKFKSGCLTSFAMDLKEVFMCTELKGMSSFFRPFNKGSEDYGRGNPHNKNGINVSYMWEDIWKKDKIIFLIERFIFVEQKETKDPDTGKKSYSESLIFPRYHQLRCIEKLMDDMIENRSSSNYLIEHSAGSGKTNTIAWLAHILSSLYDRSEKNIFDTILIITDRIIVDRQLQDAVSGIDHKLGQIKVMDDKCTSTDLADALAGNTKIVVTTIHKFYYILEQNLLGHMGNKSFAVLIDEAHSSTGGTLMNAVTTVLSGGETDDEITEEDKILDEIQKCGKQENVSMIAFTATPKPETIQLFGTLNEHGQKSAFDLYPMKQAIEEGYILNVLNNYVTWKTYFHLNKKIEEDPELHSIAAKRKIARFIDLHDTNIAQKIEIIIEHFRTNVAHLLDGKAKAMVVTSSREAAVRYKQECEKYIISNGYTDIHALVAFSGKVPIEGEDYTEPVMNGVSEEELREEFDKSSYQVLLVANKYQTGFDQPKLVAMYVDKKLHKTSAVQTLSRLNRIYPPYEKTTFILDFKNEYDDIKRAFEPYFKDTILFETITPSDIRHVEKAIDGYGILDADDIDLFNTYLYQDKRTSKDKSKMWSLLDKSLREFDQKAELEKVEVRGTIKQFLKGYIFLIQATAYENVTLHKKYNFLSYLIKEINVGGGGNDFDVADKITVSSFRQEKTFENKTADVKSTPEVKLKKPTPSNPEVVNKKLLSAIINEINSLYDKDYEPDVASKSAMQIRDLLLKDGRLRASAKNNPIDDFKFTYEDSVEDALVAGYEQNMDFYTLLLENAELRERITNVYMEEIYRLLREDK